MAGTHYFTEFTFAKAVLYSVCSLYVISTAIAVMCEPYMTLPCTYDASTSTDTFPNVFYDNNPCRTSTRYLRLMGLTPRECTFGRNLVVAVILGSIIGYERRMADRPAGIRTMAVVSLAAALFTVNSTFVFMQGPMHWDPARVSAAIPSGVGFLGAGLMVKDIYKDDEGESAFTIKGLNTAASVWLSAAVGVASGGGLYFVATFTAALMLVLLRFGPRTDVMERQESILMSMSKAPEKVSPPSPDIEKNVTDIAPTPKAGVMKRGSRKPSLNYD